MCNKRGCTIHAGTIMEPTMGIHRHCDTTLMNSTCPYLAMGCLGCTFKSLVDMDVSEVQIPPADSVQKPSQDIESVLEDDNGSIERCDCGQPFPANGYCPYCGAHQRHPGE
jgi:hypothetical protein